MNNCSYKLVPEACPGGESRRLICHDGEEPLALQKAIDQRNEEKTTAMGQSRSPCMANASPIALPPRTKEHRRILIGSCANDAAIATKQNQPKESKETLGCVGRS